MSLIPVGYSKSLGGLPCVSIIAQSRVKNKFCDRKKNKTKQSLFN